MDEIKLEIKNISKGFGEIYNREDILDDFRITVHDPITCHSITCR